MVISNFTTKFISRDNEILNDFFKEVRKYDVMSPEEEKELFARCKAGDMKARNEIILRNQRFVIALAKIYSKTEDEIADYIDEGNIGLMQAIDAFDPEKGTKFLTCAQLYIRRSMNYYLYNTNNLVVRSNNMKLAGKIDKVKEKYFKEHNIYPSMEEIVELIKQEYDIDIKDTSDVYDVDVNSINDEVNDDFTVEEDSEFTIKTSSVNDYEKAIEKESVIEQVNDVLSILPADSAKMVKMLYGIGYSHPYSTSEVADEFGICEEDVNRLKNNIITYLKDKYNKVA